MAWFKTVPRAAPISTAAAFFAVLIFSAAAPAAPRVLATIKPVHSLAAAILEGVAEPKLLLSGAASPHSYALKPSGAEALAESDAVVFVSKNLEVFLENAIRTLPAKARVIELERLPGLRLLPVRDTDWLGHDDAGGKHGNHHAHGWDVHFWLDPLNAIAIARGLAREFAEMDPEHASHYLANTAKLEAKLLLLDVELKVMLAGLSSKPFIVFHGVTQYFEKHYGLNGMGAITFSPEAAPGAKRLEAVRANIVKANAICVFSEPQFPPKLVQTLIVGTRAKQGVLDEVGAAIPPGPDQYFTLMRSNAESLAACLHDI
jgi:zinc transport system substrate-binding protein